MTTLRTDDGGGGALPHDHRELVVATPDRADPMLDPAVAGILRLVREHLQMDVVFIGEFLQGHQVLRNVQAAPEFSPYEGQSHPLADSFCQRVLDGRLPAVIPDVAALRETHDVPDTSLPIGAYMAAPVRLADGTVYGTLCCFSFEARPGLGERDYKRLQMSARLTARLIDESHGRIAAPPA